MLHTERNRFAIYYSPQPGTLFYDLGTTWLGRDNFNPTYTEQPSFEDFSASQIRQFTSSPFHYGFHGTLKPPFRLNPGKMEKDLLLELEHFAKNTKPFPLPLLEVQTLGKFICLKPTTCSAELQTLAQNLVCELDHFRMAPTREELEKRHSVPLSKLQETLLVKWGYPYVMEEFRFHLTLTGQIDDPEHREKMRRYAAMFFQQITQEPMPLSGISLFFEQDKNPMIQNRYFPFTKS